MATDVSVPEKCHGLNQFVTCLLRQKTNNNNEEWLLGCWGGQHQQLAVKSALNVQPPSWAMHAVIAQTRRNFAGLLQKHWKYVTMENPGKGRATWGPLSDYLV